MYLDELITALKELPADHVPPIGFSNPHSYRGYYSELAFEPTEGVTFGEMLASAEEALGSTYYGYKGGEYKMLECTDVYLANYGSIGEEIGPVLLRYMAMLAKPREEAKG